MINLTLKTLGELLGFTDPIIKRNSISILKRLQALNPQDECPHSETSICAKCATIPII